VVPAYVEVPVWSPVDELLAVLVENLEAIAFEGNLVVEEPGDQHVHRHLALAPRCLEFLVLRARGVWQRIVSKLGAADAGARADAAQAA
jgi:hypothetical protein